MNAPARPIRVFQVGTGNVGSEMIKRIATEPDLELIGVHCYSPDKIGKDTGELAGLAPNGVKATGTIEEIIAAKPTSDYDSKIEQGPQTSERFINQLYAELGGK